MRLYVVSVENKRHLYPVRFVPRWNYWDTESAYASALSVEGVLLEHVRIAIEQSKLCKDSTEKPKVGAVIVRNGKVVAKAFRGEDETDGHAEEIAIGKCSREQLRGAIIITTLEPCTEHGRSTRAVSCVTRICIHKLNKVVIGSPDPDDRIRGEAFEILRANNIEVVYIPSGLREEIREINRSFIADRIKNDLDSVKISRVPKG
jgi:pyrimidine deaminase RibD-like protein